MSANAMSLKAKIRNLARQKNIPAQVILQNYMFERLLLRLSVSDYRDKFVIKGGMLIAALVGLDNRATMDLDATLKKLPLTLESIQTAMQDICSIDVNDDVKFVVGTISPIREDDIYGGYRVMINAQYDTIHIPLSMDISTGDAMTPDAVNCTFNGIFDDDLSFDVWAYNIETVMAEKVETILRRSIFNTRPRDYYDAYILFTTKRFNQELFWEALSATAAHRGTTEQFEDIPASINTIAESKELQNMWNGYRKQFVYAKEIHYEMIIDVLRKLLNL